jgi:hypothetical protein
MGIGCHKSYSGDCSQLENPAEAYIKQYREIQRTLGKLKKFYAN